MSVYLSVCPSGLGSNVIFSIKIEFRFLGASLLMDVVILIYFKIGINSSPAKNAIYPNFYAIIVFILAFFEAIFFSFLLCLIVKPPRPYKTFVRPNIYMLCISIYLSLPLLGTSYFLPFLLFSFPFCP